MKTVQGTCVQRQADVAAGRGAPWWAWGFSLGEGATAANVLTATTEPHA